MRKYSKITFFLLVTALIAVGPFFVSSVCWAASVSHRVGKSPSVAPALAPALPTTAKPITSEQTQEITTGKLTIVGQQTQEITITTGQLTVVGQQTQEITITTGQLTVVGQQTQEITITTGKLIVTGTTQ